MATPAGARDERGKVDECRQCERRAIASAGASAAKRTLCAHLNLEPAPLLAGGKSLTDWLVQKITVTRLIRERLASLGGRDTSCG